jgi:hypothetical protein
MRQARSARIRSRHGSRTDRLAEAGRLDQQFAELVEVVWACERRWTLENRIEAAISCGREAPGEESQRLARRLATIRATSSRKQGGPDSIKPRRK